MLVMAAAVYGPTPGNSIHSAGVRGGAGRAASARASACSRRARR
jgi:hypothetical protein